VLGEILAKNYRGMVKTRYIDVIDDDIDEFPEVAGYLKRTGMKLPLLVINGKIIRPGLGLNYTEIVEELEELGLKPS